MGNCISHDNGKLVDQLKKHNLGLEGRDFVDFKVFIKQNKKFIPGTLRVCQNEIAFLRDKDNIQIWPLSYLRRYGYTCAGVFFFESGRRCATGEGLYTLQSHQAEKIFQCVQKRVQQNIDAYHSNSRASSVASNAHSIKKANKFNRYKDIVVRVLE
uniref:IRS-type PTB domain-containing protein n=1 Tax=Rhabditophanes sp. KR3021 TaxID=114890 RepID=A0AC35U853_9BILA